MQRRRLPGGDIPGRLKLSAPRRGGHPCLTGARISSPASSRHGILNAKTSIASRKKKVSRRVKGLALGGLQRLERDLS